MLNMIMITPARSLVVILLLSALLGGCDNSGTQAVSTAATTNYIGSATCKDCHAAEYDRWQQSHHDQAMQTMSPQTVKGDFNNSRFEHQGVSTEFYIENDVYKVRTAGPDGSIQAFELLHTFGTYPLQQYLVQLPNGRVQALSVAWDSRTEADGGQRWFHLYGDEPIDHNDVLHWTRQSQNWDTMCADCHSTGLIKQYDVATDTFNTQWEEMNVACEACHGPGKEHLTWAHNSDESAAPDKGLKRAFNERAGISWELNPSTGNSTRSQASNSSTEITVCASCHSRRAKIVPGPAHDADFLNDHLPSLIDPGLYFSDGQMLDEVYVYGSFLQSKMHEQGVTCSDCHDPHSLKLHAPGPQVCLQCHAAASFATKEHQLHETDSAGANCVECHMPSTNYMQIDARHDHSFRIPRPWLSETYGTPDACQNCHTNKTSAWATGILSSVGKGPDATTPHWSETFAAALDSSGIPRPEAILQISMDEDTPAIIKATAFSNGLFTLDPNALELLEEQLNSDDSMLRWGATRGLNYADPASQLRLAPPLLTDPVRAVRIEALPIVLSLGNDTLSNAIRQQRKRVVEEYIAVQMANPERVESHVNLGNLYRELQRFGKAEDAYKTGLRINPDFVPAYINLSDLYRLQQRETYAQNLLLQGIDRLPQQPMLQQMLGLSLVRQGQVSAALPYFKNAAEMAKQEVRYAITFALALEATGQPQAAIAYLDSVRSNYVDGTEINTATATILQRMQQQNQ